MANPNVGLTWEVAINDVGYMLADIPGEEQGYRRFTTTVEPQRFADGATPVSEAIERYSFFNSSEWRGGAGQRFLNRNASDTSSYWDSNGVDPFSEDQRLRLLPAMSFKVAASSDGCMAVAGSEYCIFQATAGVIGQYTIATDTVTAGNTHTITATDMDIGYGKGFLATGADLKEITLGSSGNTTLSTLDVYRVGWIGDRLAVIYRDSGSSTWRFSTLDSSGTEEVTGGHLTLPGSTSATMTDCEYQVGGITHGIGYVWFTGWTQDGDEGHIYVWNIDTTLSASIAMEMPKGETPVDIFYYQGGLYIWAVAANAGIVKIYRCVVNGDGTLTPFVVTTDEQGGDAPAIVTYDGRKFAADGRYVYFAWNGVGTYSGFGVIDLATGGYARRGEANDTGETVSVFVFGNRPGMSVQSRGFWVEHSFVKRTNGWLKTSLVDGDSALSKRWASIAWEVDLNANEDVDIAYTVDGGDTYTQVVSATTNETGVVDLGVESPHLGLQIDLNGDSTTTPTLRVVSAKFHPLGVMEQIVVLPINCADNLKDLKGAEILRPKDEGASQARALELLQGNFVTLQDTDWQQTAATYDFEVVQVDVRDWAQAYDPAAARGRSAMVCTVTLRRSLDVTDATYSANSAPVITDPGAQGDTVDVAISGLQMTATDADSDSLRWGASGLPTGLSISRDGYISGTPTAAGVFSVTVYANDGKGGQDSQAITWTIT